MCAIFVIPSSCSAALLAGRLQVAVLLFFLSLLFKLLNVLANVAIEYSVTKTAVHREEEKKKGQSSPYCFHVNLHLCGWFTYY